jgi:hypothetical protein
MRAVTDEFLAMLRGPHLVAASAELLFPGADPAGNWIAVPVVAGSVALDRTAAVMRTGSVTIPWSLQAAADLDVDLRVLPFGGYCRPYRGIQYADGRIELVRLGTLRVESVTWRSDDTATLELADRMAQVRDEPFLAPYMPTAKPTVTRTGTITNGSPVITAVTPNTTGLTVGMAVAGPTIPPGTVIVSVDSATQVTVNNNLGTTIQRNARMVNGRNYLDKMGDMSGLAVGMTVTSPIAGDLAPGTTVTAVYNPPRNGRQVVLNQNALRSVSRALDFYFGSGAVATFTLTFGGNVTTGQAAGEVVAQVFGDAIDYMILWDPPYELLNTAYSGSRVDALIDLAKSSSAFQFFDANGNYVFTQPPSAVDDLPVWTVDAGEQGVLISDVEALDRTGIYNGVMVLGQSDPESPPLFALVTDSDVASPTRWGGPYGHVVRIEQSSVVQTVEQATDAAQALLDSRLGLTRSVTLNQAPNPALEPGDVVTVVFEDGRTEAHVIDSIRIGLEAPAAQELNVRSRWTPASARWAPLPRKRFDVYIGDAAWQVVRSARAVAA